MGMVKEHLIVNTKPKLEKYKPQYIGNPNLYEIKSTCHNTGDMYLHSSWATWNTKLIEVVVEHLTLNTKLKLGKYKSQSATQIFRKLNPLAIILETCIYIPH